MSHQATNWAIEQKGLKPASKLILWFLADCHNPELGCFPSQDLLAERSEMSRSTVNVHLKSLEDAGLIERVASRAKGTNKQLPTRYILKFEKAHNAEKTVSENRTRDEKAVSENEQKPCPENGKSRVRNPDTNPVREPVIEPVKEREGAGAAEKNLEKKEPKSQSKPQSKADFQKRVGRFVNGEGFSAGAWPKWEGSSFDWIVARFAELSDEQKLLAEEWRDAYLRHCVAGKMKTIPVGKFFQAKQWEHLDPAILEQWKLSKKMRSSGKGGSGRGQGADDGYAAPFGPAWMAWRMCHVMRGQEVEGVECGANGIRVQRQKAWPKLTRFDNQAAVTGRGVTLPDQYHQAQSGMEFVPSESSVYADWRTCFVTNGWPHLPEHEHMNGVWFPKGGPDGLPAFAAMMGQDYKPETETETETQQGANDAYAQ